MGLTRSEQMSRIRARDTSPEREVRRLLWKEGLRYRLHAKTPVGRPDIVFLGARVAVFVDGCFWHGCPDHYVRPRSREGFWSEKLATNVRRDIEQTRKLESLGWRVCRIWEHEVFERPVAVVAHIAAAVNGTRWRPRASWRVVRVVEVDPEADRERRFMRDLRTASRRRTVTRKRSTRKWRQPKTAAQPVIISG
jgi:DNA mismatch endonuclease (patch repair protein)